MNPTWVMGFPSGHETGRILTLELGGTNLRVCRICLSSRKRDFEQIQQKFKLPEEVKAGVMNSYTAFTLHATRSLAKPNNSFILI